MPFNIGPGELILILVIALVVLGPGKLPDVAASLGKSIREFRKAATDITDAGKLDAATSPGPATPVSAGYPVAPASPGAPAPVAPAAMPAPEPPAPGPVENAPAAGAEPARDPNHS